MSFSCAAYSATGHKRRENQDTIFVSESLRCMVVMDGMGGHQGGEYASQTGAAALQSNISDHLLGLRFEQAAEKLSLAIEKTNTELHRTAQTRPELKGMGTTLCGLWQRSATEFILTNIGDSRAYFIDAKNLFLLSYDHGFVYDEVCQLRIPENEAAKHPMKNIMTRALAYEASVIPEIAKIQIRCPGALFVCSDGFSNALHHPDLTRELHRIADIRGADGLQPEVQRLVELACEISGDDNTSLALWTSIGE